MLTLHFIYSRFKGDDDAAAAVSCTTAIREYVAHGECHAIEISQHEIQEDNRAAEWIFCLLCMLPTIIGESLSVMLWPILDERMDEIRPHLNA